MPTSWCYGFDSGVPVWNVRVRFLIKHNSEQKTLSIYLLPADNGRAISSLDELRKNHYDIDETDAICVLESRVPRAIIVNT